MSAQECIDFSDTHELAVILGVAPLNISAFLSRYILGVVGGRTVDGSAIVLRTECEPTGSHTKHALHILHFLHSLAHALCDVQVSPRGQQRKRPSGRCTC